MKKETDIPILIADYGRSGQGWLSYMLCYILNAKYIEPHCLLRGIVYSGHQYIMDLTQGNLDGREKTKYSMVVKTHDLPDPFFSLTDKVILLARDPRDVAVSALARNKVRQTKGTDVEKGAQEMSLKKTISTNNIGLVTRFKIWLLARKYFCFPFVAYRWGKFYEGWEDIDISFHVTYEELSAHPKETLMKILNYLEIKASDALVEEAIEKFKFQNITKRKSGVEDRADVAFRKGVVGDYANHFNKLDLSIFSTMCGKIARKWGYIL